MPSREALWRLLSKCLSCLKTSSGSPGYGEGHGKYSAGRVKGLNYDSLAVPDKVQMALRERVAPKIKTIRERRGLTQQQLAEKAGIGRNYLARLEQRGRTLLN